MKCLHCGLETKTGNIYCDKICKRLYYVEGYKPVDNPINYESMSLDELSVMACDENMSYGQLMARELAKKTRIVRKW